MNVENSKLLCKVERLTAALKDIAERRYPRVPGEYEDQCAHEVYLEHDDAETQCPYCMAAYAKKVILEEDSQ